MHCHSSINTILSALCALVTLSYSTIVHTGVKITDIYEAGEHNVVMTSTARNHINNQYVYTPYGQQRNLNQPAHPTDNAYSSTEQALFDQIRQPLNLQHNQFTYTGQAADPSTSLMMLGGFRNYAPGIGQFIQPDTYNSFSKTSINNRYAYVDNNPLSAIDPTGHSPLDLALDALSPVSLNSKSSMIGLIATGATIAALALGAGASFVYTALRDGGLDAAEDTDTALLSNIKGALTKSGPERDTQLLNIVKKMPANILNSAKETVENGAQSLILPGGELDEARLGLDDFNDPEGKLRAHIQENVANLKRSNMTISSIQDEAYRPYEEARADFTAHLRAFDSLQAELNSKGMDPEETAPLLKQAQDTLRSSQTVRTLFANQHNVQGRWREIFIKSTGL